jgi:hypothetical protein
VSHDASASSLTSGSLPPSVVEVQQAQPPSGPAQLLLVSSGHGDVSVIVQAATESQQPMAITTAAAAALSAPIFPLRPAPPLQGIRPMHLLAAFQLPSASAAGAAEQAADIFCILWAPRPRSERQPSRCEVYAVRLAALLAPVLALQVVDVQLLKARTIA